MHLSQLYQPIIHHERIIVIFYFSLTSAETNQIKLNIEVTGKFGSTKLVKKLPHWYPQTNNSFRSQYMKEQSQSITKIHYISVRDGFTC